MSELVTDEVVEAAAEAMWLARPMRRTTDGSPLPFAEAKSYERRRHLEQARHALEAAAPLIAAQARSESAQGLRGWYQDRMDEDTDPTVDLTDYEHGREIGTTEGILAASLQVEASK